MRLPRRHTVWLIAALLLVVVVGAWLFAPRSRITQTNYDRIDLGMSDREIEAIIGKPEPDKSVEVQAFWGWAIRLGAEVREWRNGPNRIVLHSQDGKVFYKELHLATAWETLNWYAKKGAEKIGVKWD
jgi:hypothetical protein